MKDGETHVDEIFCRTPENEAVGWRTGPYLCMRLSGRYTEELAEALRQRAFNRDASLAIDASLLTNIPAHFAREIYFAARNKMQGDQRLVLVHPPEQLKGLLRLLSEKHGIPAVQDFRQLPADPKLVEKQAKELEVSLERMKSNLQTNALWQFVDREACWVCPYCACPLDDSKIISRVSIPGTVVEKIHAHLTLRCPNYDPTRTTTLGRSQLQDAVQRINAEKFSAARSRTQELQSRVSELEEKGKWADEMEKGLKGAVARQKYLLLSKPPEIPGVEAALVYRPSADISGDFYDFIDLGDGRTIVFIGDVSGHGIEAGILMGMTKKVLQIRLTEMPDARQAVLRANADLHRELDKKSFVTSYVAVLDPGARKLTCIRAGHNPCIIVNPVRSPAVLYVEPRGTILGMSVGPAIEQAMQVEEVPLLSGDLVVLYTDGLEEAKNPKEEMFGRDRIVEVLRREHGRPLSYILGALSYEFDRFSAGVPQEDDVTIIGLRIA